MENTLSLRPPTKDIVQKFKTQNPINYDVFFVKKKLKFSNI